MRNIDIRIDVGAFPKVEFVERQRIKWFGHLVKKGPTLPADRA